MDSKRFSSALLLCVDEYKDDFRKSSGAPGIHHPLGVCELVMGAGGDEDTAIAALFHDFAEDKGGEEMLSRIRAEFGERVERIVRDCSDTIPSDYSMKEYWIDRKVAHILHIADLNEDSRLVLTADTLHNARDHVRGLRTYGDKWWLNFRANVFIDRELTTDICAASTLWYLEHKALALMQHTELANVGIRDIYEFDGSILSDLIQTVQSVDEHLTKAQWGIFIDACALMKAQHSIG